MKNILAFLFIVMLSAGKGQNKFPMPGADWHYMTRGGGFSGPYFYNHVEEKNIKDSLFLGRNARFMSPDCFSYPGSAAQTFFYMSNDSVFFYNAYSLGRWQQLYNFSAIAGQSWEFRVRHTGGNGWAKITVQVDSVKTVVINSHALKKQYVRYTAHDSVNNITTLHSSEILERIGDLNYIFNNDDGTSILCDGCTYMMGLLCYQDSTFALYQPDTAKGCNYAYTGIEKFTTTGGGLSVWPNPAGSLLTVEWNEEIKSVRITDVLGKEVLRTKEKEIDVSGLESGVYFIEAGTAKGAVVAKFIKQ